MIEIQMPIWKDYHILNRRKDNNKNLIIVCMTYLTDEEERVLDKNKVLEIIRGNDKFTINPNNVYCYGSVDLHTNSNDYEIIEDFDFLDYLVDVGLKIYSDYDYETHTCKSPINRLRWTETWNPAEIVQYAHGVLGKPEKIVLFKYNKNLYPND